MMRRIISTIAVLSVSLVTCIVASSAYAAEPPVWVVKEHTLKAGETRTALMKFSKLKIRWEDKTTTTKFEVECKKASGEAELKGGFPGTDKLKTLTFEECTLIKGATGCKLAAGSVMAEELPGWPTELKLSPLADAATGVRFSLALKECEKGSFNKTWIFKGNLKAQAKNESGKVKFTLPTLAGGAEPLETEGDEASLSGAGELEIVSEALSVEEAMGHWFNESNVRFAEGVRMNTVIENVGNTTLVAKLEGIEVEIVCPAIEGEGWIENPTGGGAGKNNDLVVYKKCTVPKPGGGCKVSKERFRLAPSVIGQGSLAYNSTAIFDDLGNYEFSTITLEGCENASLNKAWSLTGELVGEPNNEKSAIKFTSTSGSTLKMGGQTATLTSEDKIEIEGGGKIQVG